MERRSPRLVVDASGAVLKRVDYDAFGNVVLDTAPAVDLPFGFAGGMSHPDHELIRFGARDYQPSRGRWTLKDPLLLASGDQIYGYVSNDPVNLIDRSGLRAPSACSSAKTSGLPNPFSPWVEAARAKQRVKLAAAELAYKREIMRRILERYPRRRTGRDIMSSPNEFAKGFENIGIQMPSERTWAAPSSMQYRWGQEAGHSLGYNVLVETPESKARTAEMWQAYDEAVEKSLPPKVEPQPILGSSLPDPPMETVGSDG